MKHCKGPMEHVSYYHDVSYDHWSQKFWRKQAFTLGNSAKLYDTLGNSMVKNQDPWKFHLELLYLEHPWKFHFFLLGCMYVPKTTFCFFNTITLDGNSMSPPLFFFWNSPFWERLAAWSFRLQNFLPLGTTYRYPVYSNSPFRSTGVATTS